MIHILDEIAEALFNLAEAYAFMLLPLLLWDRPQRNVYNWWAPAMFLTNALRNCRDGSPRVEAKVTLMKS